MGALCLEAARHLVATLKMRLLTITRREQINGQGDSPRCPCSERLTLSMQVAEFHHHSRKPSLRNPSTCFPCCGPIGPYLVEARLENYSQIDPLLDKYRLSPALWRFAFLVSNQPSGMFSSADKSLLDVAVPVLSYFSLADAR